MSKLTTPKAVTYAHIPNKWLLITINNKNLNYYSFKIFKKKPSLSVYATFLANF